MDRYCLAFSLSGLLNLVRCCPPEVQSVSAYWVCVDLSYFSLEAAEELCQVGVFSGQGQDPFLGQSAVNIVILQDHVFLQHFDGVHFVAAFQLG